MPRWVLERESRDLHVTPIKDLKEHGGALCWCQPYREEQPNGTQLYIHHSADGREYFEPDYEPLGERSH